MNPVSYIGDLIPDVFLDSVYLEKSRVVIHMHIKEYIYPSGLGTWFTEPEYKNLLNIEVSQDVRRNSLQGRTGRGVVKTISASRSIHSTERLIKEDMRGRFQEVRYRVILDNYDYSNLTDLSFSARTIITRDDISRARGITFKVAQMQDMVGKTSRLEVMQNGEVRTKTMGYFLGDEFYTGPKTQLENGRWVTGSPRTRDSKFLTTREIPRIDVADYRDLYDILPQLGNPVTANDPLSDPNLNHFSELKMNRDRDGNLRFFFILDYESSYTDKSLYGGVFSRMTPLLKDRVLLSSAIRKIEVSRKRLSHTVDTEEEVFVIAGENVGDRFIPANAVWGALSEEELNFQKGDLLLRSFSGTDRAAKNFNAGRYRYSVSAEVEDGIYSFIQFQQRDLNYSKMLLTNYRNELYNPKNYDKQTDIYDAGFIDSLMASISFGNLPYIRALVAITENISFLTDNLTKEQTKRYLDTVRYDLSPRTGTAAGVERALATLSTLIENMEKLKRICDLGGPRPYTPVAPDINKNASAGNLKFTIRKSFGKIFNAGRSYDKGLGYLSSLTLEETDATNGIRKIPGAAFEERVTMENTNFFNGDDTSFSISLRGNSVNSEARNTSFSYLTPSSAVIGQTAYVISTGISTGAAGSLTVKSLSANTSEEEVDLILSSLEASDTPGTFSENLDITPYADDKFSMHSPLTENDTDNTTKDSIRKFNLSFNSRQGGYTNPFTTAAVTAVNVASQVSQESKEYIETKAKIANMKPMSRFTNIDHPTPGTTQTDPDTLASTIASLTSQVIGSGPTLDIVSMDGHKRTIAEADFNLLPNHFKAIYSAGTSFGEELTTILTAAAQGDNARFKLILGSMVKVEALAGLKKSPNGNNLIGSENFIPFTQAYYNFNAGKNIFCRLVPYENAEIGLKRFSQAQIFDEYFIINVPATAGADDAASLLQLQLNSARTLSDIEDILSGLGYGDEDTDTAKGGGGGDPNECDQISEEKAVEAAYGRTAGSSAAQNSSNSAEYENDIEKRENEKKSARTK